MSWRLTLPVYRLSWSGKTVLAATAALFLSSFSTISNDQTTVALAQSKDQAAPEADEKTSQKLPAPPLDGGVGFLDTYNPRGCDQPFALKDLKGRFVLLDFWTFCCINCMHILPSLDELEHKYADQLTVIGIHSAKFENEKDDSAIRKAIVRYDIKHAVINDADFKIWDAYNVKAWPTLVLIDPHGDIVGRYSGEGHAAEIAALIDKLTPAYLTDGTLKKGANPLTATRLAQKDQLFKFPGKVALSKDQRKLVVSDTGQNRVVVLTLTDDGKGFQAEKVIGSGQAGFKNGSSKEACFNHPQGVCFADNIDDQETLYVADTLNHAVRKIDLKNGNVTTVCGNGRQAPSGNIGGDFKNIQLNSPWDLVFEKGKLWVAMAGSHQIWCLDLALQKAAVFAGSGRETIVDSNDLKKAALSQPSGLTFGGPPDQAGQFIYIADAEDSGIRAIDMQNQTLQTLIGKGLFVFGDSDGPIQSAKLQHPLGVSFSDGTVFIADSYNHKIKALDLKNSTVKTLAGTGKVGLKNGSNGLNCQFSEPGGLVAGKKMIYVADTNNNVVRYIDLNSKTQSTGTLTKATPQKNNAVKAIPATGYDAR
ncbi:MAG: redoxin domain-containing protein [Cyanobacteria bacterium REEB67]|nr:redoxin domain-containing protein [Cyanobacteria bacterium REEB67]